MFWRSSKSKRQTVTRKSPLDLQQLDFNQLPILQAREIIDLLDLEQRLKSIEILTGAGREYYQLLYEPALHRYIESVQLAPASASHHHAGPGGLVVHTLDVIDIALRKRKSYNLPQHSTPESIAEQEHVWTYAIFTGAILHDIGKLVCSTRMRLDTGSIWTPHDASILESGASHYTVVFEKARYKLHTQLSNAFLHLLPSQGRGWLAQYSDILAQLTAWLAGDYYEWGLIGDVVRQADQESVAKNLGLGGDRERFPNAPTIPLVDKLTTSLRQLLDEGQLIINRPEGSSGWSDGPYTYLVCGTVADAVRTHLLNAGATDVPVDNTRIFDTWQEHGFVICTPEDGAVWHLTINQKLTLTVLKFETNRLFHPSRRPEPFSGNLTLLAGKPERKTTVGPSNASIPAPGAVGPSNTSNPAPGAVGPSNASNPVPGAVEPSNASNPVPGAVEPSNTSNPAPGTVGPSNTSNPVPAAVGPSNASIPAPGTVGPSNTSNPTPGAVGPSNTSAPVHVKNIYMADDSRTDSSLITLENPELAQHFLDWIKSGLRDHSIFVNRSDALLHVVKEGLLIVSPLAFKKFVRLFDLADGIDADNGMTETKAATKIQKQLERMMTRKNLHRKTANGMNIHTYLVQGAHKESKIKGWLLPIDLVYGTGHHPEPNRALSNLSGFHQKKIKKSMGGFSDL